MKTIKHRNCEVSIMELHTLLGIKYKVTRRFPEMSISETKIFRSKKKASALKCYS
ncbi:hypothetical protein J4401_03270 [Candidatus Woesearchaeota archaeon]|nr:hypothetical protein [Candidatus Woesearchaeota archaeon]